MHELHLKEMIQGFSDKYVSTKTTGQLVLDLGSTISHICALVAFLRVHSVGHNVLADTVLALLVIVIILNVSVGVLLFGVRITGLESKWNQWNEKRARLWNEVTFFALLFVAILEVTIVVMEKFYLEHPSKSDTLVCNSYNSSAYEIPV